MAKSEFVIHNSSNGSLAQYVCGAFVELLFLNHVGFCSVEKCIDALQVAALRWDDDFDGREILCFAEAALEAKDSE